MIEHASRDIQRDAVAAELRRREAARLPALVAALDDLLNDLEELNLQGISVAPDTCRQRAAELLAEAVGPDAVPAPAETVADLMGRVYEAQDAVLLRRRRVGWGLEVAGPPRRRM